MNTDAIDPSPVLSSYGLDVAPAANQPALLSGVNLHVFPGRLHGLAGPNGCGKTTLISTLAGFRRPRAGSVRLAHRDMRSVHPADRARSIAVVLTERTDTAFLHVDELVALGRLPFNPGSKLRKVDHEICADAIARLGLEHLRRRKVATLSDGERQRALIARAISQAPSVLLLDEPTAHLDVAGEVEIVSHLLSIARKDNIAVLASSHKLQLMLSWCDSLSLIHPDGSLVTGIPEELALAGEVSRTFDTSTVRFNTVDLRFNSCRSRDRWFAVEVRADGEHGIWTRRALERLGFIENAGAPLKVIVNGGEHTITWHVIGALPANTTDEPNIVLDETQGESGDEHVDATFSSLTELVRFLENVTRRRTSPPGA